MYNFKDENRYKTKHEEELKINEPQKIVVLNKKSNQIEVNKKVLPANG